jgi:mRNA interferase RelE/StbE
MSYSIVLSPAARKSLARLPAETSARITTRISTLTENPRPPGAVALQGVKGDLRLRVGDYRIIYIVEDESKVVRVVKIAHRSEVYRRQ